MPYGEHPVAGAAPGAGTVAGPMAPFAAANAAADASLEAPEPEATAEAPQLPITEPEAGAEEPPSISHTLFQALLHMKALQTSRDELAAALSSSERELHQLREFRVASAAAENTAAQIAMDAERSRVAMQTRLEELESLVRARAAEGEPPAGESDPRSLLQMLQAERHRCTSLELQLRASEEKLERHLSASETGKDLETEKRGHARTRQALRLAEIKACAAEAQNTELEHRIEKLTKQLTVRKTKASGKGKSELYWMRLEERRSPVLGAFGSAWRAVCSFIGFGSPQRKAAPLLMRGEQPSHGPGKIRGSERLAFAAA